MESSERHNTLVHFRFNPEYKAERGRHGEGSNRTGREGEDVILKVPVGTIVFNDETGELVHDFSRADERIIVAKGGRGEVLAMVSRPTFDPNAFAVRISRKDYASHNSSLLV